MAPPKWLSVYPLLLQILEAFHHPWFASDHSRIQAEMFQTLKNWVYELENADETIQALSKVGIESTLSPEILYSLVLDW